jgi:hypothetical protein
VLATLNALEERLHELERELASLDPAPGPVAPAARPPSSSGPPPPKPPASRSLPERGPLDGSPSRAGAPPRPWAPVPAALTRSSEDFMHVVADAQERMRWLHTQVDDLLQLRDGLRSCAQELIEDYREALASPGSVDGDLDRHAAPALDGRVLLDAGPFGDLATLGTFEQALGRIPEVEDVYVRAFEGNRAHFELTLIGSAPLIELMRASLPHSFSVSEADGGRVAIELESVAHWSQR